MILQQGGDLLAASEQVINQILADMRAALDAKKRDFVPRKINMDTLAKLGLTPTDAYDEIYDLAPEHYFEGPITDRGKHSEDDLWVFKKIIMGHMVYIKFKIKYLDNGQIKVVSFHLDNGF